MQYQDLTRTVLSRTGWQLILFLSLWFPASNHAASGNAEGSLPLADLGRQFANPGPEYRGKPFWSWNGELKKDELIRQIHVLKEMGMGGFFMHSRTGLRTEYLGEEWFRLINACADEARKLKLEAWLYDEDRWPSGTAGGLVTENPKYRQKFISLRTVPGAAFQWSDDIVAAFACRLDGTSFTDCRQLTREMPAGAFQGQTVLVFTIEPMEKSSFFNGYTDVDRLSREATDYFIQLTHEKYRKLCGDRLGKSIKGMFTDEPHRGAVMTGFSLSNTNKLRMAPWTEALPAKFKERFGYDLVERLPELFLKKGGQAIAPVKWHYMELLQQMFLENWAKPNYDWCVAHNLIFTGHVLHEDSLTCQAAMQGSLMRFYEYMHYPGVDVLTEGNRNYWIVKQLASAARQLGRKWMLSELYGCTGWQFNFESHKAVGDWQALFGINLRCPHLSWYTMGGEAKRDYPASIFYQSGWWPDYHFVEDYYSRLNLILAQGQPACDVLVLNPIESVWCQIGVGWCDGLSPKTKPIQQLEAAYRDIFLWLAGSQIDFDYGDEEMVGRLHKVERDANGQAVLRVGRAEYRVVVVPKMTTIRAGTLKLLDAFRQAGGKVIFVGEPPAYVEAVASPSAAELAAKARQVAWSREALVEACQESLRAPVQILDAAGSKPLDDIFCQLRTDGQTQYLVAMNMSRDKAFPAARIRVKAGGTVSEWDCLTGKRYAANAVTKDGWTELTADFPPVGEHVFVLTAKAVGVLPTRAELKEVNRRVCEGPFDYSLSEPNVCVLDLARCRINDQAWQPEAEVLKVDRAVRKAFGLPFRGGEMVQPWFSKKFEPKPEIKGKVRMIFAFSMASLPPQPIQLALEEPENFRIALNGQRISSAAAKGWWVDPAIRTIVLPAKYFRPGANELELAMDFRQDMNLEALYLLGQFGVLIDGTRKTLTPLPDKLAVGDLAKQGLPFYSGSVTYRIPVAAKPAKGQSLFVAVPKFEAACIKVKSGKRAPQLIAWQPYQADVTEDAAKSNTLDLEVVLTRRNTFGPLHQVPLRAGAYGPGNWTTEGAGFSQNYMLYPAGLLQAPVLVTKAAQ